MKKIDHTGMVYGACEILGPGPKKKTWKTRCTNCGTVTVRTDAGIRGIKANASQYRGCATCRNTYAERRKGVRGLRPRSDIDEVHGDIGVRWKDSGGFESTKIGIMQQRFYLGVGLE
jgi:hypothetical protein